jgi:membrane associated rhomboid family serine protease
MLPLRDNVPASRFPAMTVALIVINVIVFLFEVQLGSKAEYFLMDFGIVPARYTDPGVAEHFTVVEQAVPFLSSMFLHGGWIHLLGNMWTLWIFGDNVEDQLGRGKFIALYLIGGLMAGLLHIITNASSMLPTVGASGAVAAVMGAYFRFFPHARIETIIPPFFFVFELPALFFLGWWFLLQFFNGTMTLLGGRGDFGGVAWWAHIGGFLFGLYIAGRFARRRRTPTYDYDRWE